METKDTKAVVKIDYLPCVNYAMINSGVEVCNSMVVENNDDKDWQQVSICVSGQYVKESVGWLDMVKMGRGVQVSMVKVEPDFKILSETTEAIKTSFVVTVRCGDELLFENEYPITLLSYEEWAGSGIMPEYLAAFVVPNNPLLPKIKIAAAKFLESWTGSAAFDEYQTTQCGHGQ